MKPIFVLLAALLLLGCSRSTKLTVVNASGVELKNVVASGPRFSVSLGTLAAGQERRVKIGPHGESSLRLAFEAGGRQIATGPDGYFETGYKVTAKVAPDFSVTVQSEF